MDITIKNLEHRYQPNTPFERVALDGINLSIRSGSFVSIIGHTGSGKSTLVQHLNGLLKPISGSIQIGEKVIRSSEKAKQLKELRRRVGIVFQYPEHQLFEETIEKDIIFGPMNFGVSEEEAKKKAREVIKLVGLPEDYLNRSPFDLSGGQMRRVAIAGVLAMEPRVIVLDEPTAGLDPRGKVEIMNLFYQLHSAKGLTTILVTHSMEDAALYSDEIIVMDQGKVFHKGTPVEVFKDPVQLRGLGLDVPETVEFVLKLEEKFGKRLPRDVFTVEEAANVAVSLIRKEGEE
ncbi:energy-coupling factor ABC transporter ATP-binding protein [Pseudalkalibacillus caeni]|uniref:Energy-coupling factor transporter ATP-binding protein EcfA2 n=1 Tax=Exobacillus caeni TaxID=2574798 RepID=A0A5R9F1Z6_9BACL|nr:energy-coupling factor ABC transporter ATP-binding protein [Pseudalkalibacillus caeni]TLS35488.1 energy-coupling factor ABC transporter ATP-binding protein [Pseudalkalibacillus caeni]